MVWDVATGKTIRRLPMPPGFESKDKKKEDPYLVAAAFGPDSKTLAGLSSRGHLFLFDVSSGKQLRQLIIGKGDEWDVLAFSPDGKKKWPSAGQFCGCRIPCTI